jgi:tetratricopeptide (TPR) repeat protein
MQIIMRSLGVAVLAFVPTLSFAQDEAKQLIAQAYQKTKSAESLDDFAAVIDLCQQAQAYDLSAANDKYVRQLQAWALNRRGQAFVDQAARLLEEGDAKRAAQFDGKALADFEAAVKHDPTRWKAFHNRGVSYALAGKYKEAIADFSTVIEQKPDYENAWFNRGEIQYELGQFEAAITDYSQALEIEPGDFGAITGRGHAHYQLRQFTAALDDYAAAIELAPDTAAAYSNRGDTYCSLQEWEKAAADYRQAIELDPDSARGYQGAAWLMATCPEERFRNVKLGLQAATKAVELTGEQDYEILDTLAAAYASAGRFEDAVNSMSKAIKLAPPAASAVLAQRLELYNTETPYREPLARTASVEGDVEGDTVSQ